MKKLILLAAVMGLALAPLTWAGDDKAKDKAACCEGAKAQCAKGGCPAQGGTCPMTGKSSAKASKDAAKAEKKAAKAEKKAAAKKAPEQN